MFLRQKIQLQVAMVPMTLLVDVLAEARRMKEARRKRTGAPLTEGKAALVHDV